MSINTNATLNTVIQLKDSVYLQINFSNCWGNYRIGLETAESEIYENLKSKLFLTWIRTK